MATIPERIIEALGGVTAVQLEAAISRAAEAAFFDGNDDPATGDFATGGQGYRQMSSGLRDFSQLSHGQILDTIWTLWQSSPIANRAMKLKRDHIVGTSATLETDDEKLGDILHDFFSLNQLGARIPEFCLQLFLLGEQIYPAFVRESDGRTKLGYIDPSQIAKVVQHPDNAMERWIVITKQTATTPPKAYRIIRPDGEHVEGGQVIPPNYPGKLVTAEQANIQPWETAVLTEAGISGYSGSVFFFPVNCLSNQTRGISDLVQVADWIDQADETLFNLAEREQMAGYFAFDITLANADETAVAARAKALAKNPPKKGSLNVHNDAESWELHAPDLKQPGSVATFTALLTFIMGGLGYPVAWFGFGTDTNRATLGEQASPSEKTLEHDQTVFRRYMLTIAQFVADQAEIAGHYKPTAEKAAVTLTLPPIRPENLKELAAIFAPLVAALTAAEDAQHISRETAVKITQFILGEMGIEIDSDEESQRLDSAEEEEETRQNERLNGRLTYHIVTDGSRELIKTK